ncbi:hypothetical protein RJ640_016736 [Escallonia rubra]|uniref:MADS-box domain-containing protein n=1 Tax=Escallonia rubra TaxID=112253 RepID=A0AA88U7Y6_9ASTE|nr:hypothetical protein RJ640_016736 [Escallonia rubra]
MVRSKVNLEYIENDSRRKSCFNKRKRGLMKKVHELSTLCDVDACAILLGQNKQDPEVWPSSLDARRVIANFRSMPHYQQKMATQESFIGERIRKFEEKHIQQRRKNRQTALNCLVSECLAGRHLDQFDLKDLNDIGWMSVRKIGDISRRIRQLKSERQGETGTEVASVTSVMPMNASLTHAANSYQPRTGPVLNPDLRPGLGMSRTLMQRGLGYSAYTSDGPGPSAIYP